MPQSQLRSHNSVPGCNIMQAEGDITVEVCRPHERSTYLRGDIKREHSSSISLFNGELEENLEGSIDAYDE